VNQMSIPISITRQRLAWGLDEAAESIGVSKRFLWNEIRRGKLGAIKRGRRVLIHADALDRYLRDEGEKYSPAIGSAEGA
jgi:excisionase family DNA binding protein